VTNFGNERQLSRALRAGTPTLTVALIGDGCREMSGQYLLRVVADLETNREPIEV